MEEDEHEDCQKRIAELEGEVARLKRREGHMARRVYEIRMFCADQILGAGLTRRAALQAIRKKAQQALSRTALAPEGSPTLPEA